MAERKSKPKHASRSTDDDEKVGLRKMFENPLVILGLVILFIVLLVGGIFLLSEFLSGGG